MEWFAYACFSFMHEDIFSLSLCVWDWCLVSLAVTDKLTWHHYYKGHITSSNIALCTMKWSHLKSFLTKSWWMSSVHKSSCKKQVSSSIPCESSSMVCPFYDCSSVNYFPIQMTDWNYWCTWAESNKWPFPSNTNSIRRGLNTKHSHVNKNAQPFA